MRPCERFAPSPTGPLHLGHAFSALTAFEAARAADGRFLLRIEDIDRSRSRPEWEDAIYEDLHWLGLSWDEPVMRQSERAAAYQATLDRLARDGLLFGCTCKRRDILDAISAPQEGAAPPSGPDGVIYPGTCRGKPVEAPGAALRLDMRKTVARIGGGIDYREIGDGAERHIAVSADDLITTVGDVVLARRDMGTSYHLSVVVDDADQGVNHVTRGRDLAEATAIHVVLQRLLGLPTPVYRHHRLIRDEAGKRLAKRDDARALRTYRAAGLSPEDIRTMVGL